MNSVSRISLFLLAIILLTTGCQDEQYTGPDHEVFFTFETRFNHSGDGQDNLHVGFELNKETSRRVNLTYELGRFTKDRMVEVDKVELFHGVLPKGDRKEFEVPIRNLRNGKYNIKIQALSEEDENGRWGGLRDIVFSVDDGTFTIEYEADINE
ncbi:hypothetical protein [Bacillus alkalicellulosilyticus]|uniref:hypothetical protein n=1 Tax=Alkalihalobacterium alkalicellulosilyticum TaxID=1912214 RepID=UPI0009962777|nr:hypothetical protein [Bacillus alkalicellulosilyticus]